MENKCFICDLDKTERNFDKEKFLEHTLIDHNLWNYVYYSYYLK